MCDFSMCIIVTKSRLEFIASMDEGRALTEAFSGKPPPAGTNRDRPSKYLPASVNLRYPLASQQIEQSLARTRKLHFV